MKILLSRSTKSTIRFGFVSVVMLSMTLSNSVFALGGKYDQTFYSNNNIEFYNPQAQAQTCSSGLSGNGNQAKIWNWLISNGMSENGAAGIMGNMQSESGFNPFRIQGKGPGNTGALRTYSAMVASTQSNSAFGLVQWDGVRRPVVLQYIISQGNPGYKQYISDTYGNGENDYTNAPSVVNDTFLTLELQYMKKESTPGGGRSMVWNDLIQSDSPGKAADVFNEEFEGSTRPAGGTQHSNADSIYHSFTGKGIPPVAGTSSSSCGSLGTIQQGGLTETQAKQFMMNYGANKNNASVLAVNSSPYGRPSPTAPGGILSDCTAFSAFFLNKFTDTKFAGGDGGSVVSNLKNYSVSTGSTPKLYAVFSITNSPGHTGVVLGIHGNTVIVGNASYGNPGTGKGDGTLAGGGAGFIQVGQINTAAPWYGGSVPTEFAYPTNVNVNAIQGYINGNS